MLFTILELGSLVFILPHQFCDRTWKNLVSESPTECIETGVLLVNSCPFGCTEYRQLQLAFSAREQSIQVYLPLQYVVRVFIQQRRVLHEK